MSEKAYHIYINSTRNKAGLCRSINLLRRRDAEIQNSVCLLQYTIAREGCNKVVYEVPFYENSKTNKEQGKEKTILSHKEKYVAGH